jgi:colanic acid/amylovoran biosynthesis glycosyltransferase
LGGDVKKIEKWHLGIDLSQFKYQPPDQSFDGTTVHCLHVGRLVEKKAPVHLVRAINYAKNDLSKKYNLQLKIAGDGPLREDTKREIRDLDLGNSVHLLGAVSHEDVYDLLRKANIYTQHCKTASDGDQEGQGVSFVEASASGLPIVSTRHNGLPDVVLHGETGILVEEGDSKGMGEQIAYLARRPSKWNELGAAGREHVKNNFNLKDQAEKMIHKYKKI